MTLAKDHITTAKEMAKTLQTSGNDELIVVGNLLAYLLAEREKVVVQNCVPAIHHLDTGTPLTPFAYHWEPTGDVILAKNWTADKPPEGWEALYKEAK